MSDPLGNQHNVEELTVRRADKALHVGFEDGTSVDISFELLRVESPSAEVQGHGPGEKKLVHGRAHVGVIGLEPVGNYAIKIIFDDLHDSGLYTWDYLYWLGHNQDRLWQDYLAALDQAGLSRYPDPKAQPAAKSGGCGCGSGGSGGGCGG